MTELFNDDCRKIIKDIKPENCVIVTDPPFNVGYHYNSYSDNMAESDYYKMLDEILCGQFVIIHYPESIYKFAIQKGQAPEKVVSWVYNSNTGKQHRDIAFFNIKPDFSKVRQHYKNPNDKRIAERLRGGAEGAKLYDWWEINQVKNVSKEKTEHPCQMPLEVMMNIIGILPEGYTILDPCMGRGTTGEACRILQRDFIGIELDTKYFKIAKNRIESLLF